MISRYDIFEFISQRKEREMPEENEKLALISNVIRAATESSRNNEDKSTVGTINVSELNELEKRTAENWAKENNCWIPFEDIFNLGAPGPSGSESDTYVSKNGYVYKSNNLLHCHDSILVFLGRTIIYNLLFPDSAYTFVGFAGFEGRSVFPVVCQGYVESSIPATQNEIDCYMAAIGFEKVEKGKFINCDLVVSDVLPKNVLKDTTGDLFVIDVEINLKID